MTNVITKQSALQRQAPVLLIGAGIALAGALTVLLSDRKSDLTPFVHLLAWAAPTALAIRLIQLQRQSDAQHRQSRELLTMRSQMLDRLLDFAQTIQGAGKSDQIFSALGHYLQTQLGLTGIAIISCESEGAGAVEAKFFAPSHLLRDDPPVTEMDAALCPCLRQNLPRHFRGDSSPVRCAIDQSLKLPPTYPAYCIPFNVGPKTRILVHMLLAQDQHWTEDQRQLAQTYVNAGSSSLITLHHLAEAETQSLTDSLTGLYNRRSMEQLLQREVALAERHNLPLSIVMIDMDGFKQINDEHGHAAGDHMLRAFADCVHITLRKTDLAFRYGGDEFAIALPQTPVTQAQQVVQKLRQAFASVDFSSAIAHLDQQPTLSIGIAERSPAVNLLTLQSILAAADVTLYEAKAAGRNCVRTYQPPRI